MKKLSKKELKKYLLSKRYTYKELSNITGYHEKSLIRLNRELKNNTFKEEHGNLNKKPPNKIDDNIKNDLIKIYNDNNFKNKKEFFNYLKKQEMNYSYSYLCKIIPTKKKIIIKKEKTASFIKRKLIKDNLIQYQNIRYRIIKSPSIKHLETVILVVDKNKTPLYVIYKKKKYNLKVQKILTSTKGNSKYS